MQEYIEQHNTHRIRKQKKIILPSDVSPDDIYNHPGDLPGDVKLQHMGIPISQEALASVSNAVKERYPEGYKVFTSAQDEWARRLYLDLCKVQPGTLIRSSTAWTVFEQMLHLHHVRGEEAPLE